MICNHYFTGGLAGFKCLQVTSLNYVFGKATSPEIKVFLGFSFGRLRIEPIATPGRGNHNFEGKTYLLSWKEGQNHFSWTQARDWCKSNGMRIVSLDSPAKRDHFLGLTSSQGVEFFWTGGRLSSDKTELMWENGVKQPIARG